MKVVESFEEICKKKQNKDINIEWSEIAKMYNMISAESARQKWKRIRKLSNELPKKEEVKINGLENKITNIEMEKINIQKERYKLQDQRRELNKLIKQQARKEYLEEKILETIEGINQVEPFIYKENKYIASNKEMLSIFSDWHVGINTDNHWGKYNTDIFHNRINQYINEIIRIGKEHNVDKVTILALGDFVQGVIHNNARILANEDVIKQVQIVSETISKCLYTLSSKFNQVDFHSIVGNHGRVHPNKEDSIEDENFELIIDWYLKARCNDLRNVSFIENTYDKDIIDAKIFNYLILGVHGDKDRASKLTNVVENLTLMTQEIPYLIVVGHRHHYAEDCLHNVNIAMSGSLCGTDEYAKSIRKTSSPSQLVMIFNEQGKECSYNIVLK